MKQKAPLTPEILVPRLGDYLVEKNWLTPQQLQHALAYQNTRRGEEGTPLIGQVLIELGYLTREQLDEAVTEQIIQLRAALQDSNQQLEQRVHERTADLELALQKLETVNQLKSNIVANISHELRTPLTHLEGYLELLKAQELGALNDEQMRAVLVLVRATDRLDRLIEDLILYSLTERDNISLRIQPAKLSDVLSATFNRSRDLAAERKVELVFSCPADLPVVELDIEKISWVVSQLLDNAIKFTPQGGQVGLKAEQTGSFVRVSVTDTGIGISPDKINDVFEPFYQLDGSSTRKYGGTGLGLALVKRIIEAHGATIHVTSNPGKGSTFAFSLKGIPRSH